MYFSKKSMERNMRDLQKDAESGEFTATAWLWVVGGSLLGFLASCLKPKKEEMEPILAKLDRSKNRMED